LECKRPQIRPFVFAGEKFFNPRKFDSQAETGGPETVIKVNWQPSQPARKVFILKMNILFIYFNKEILPICFLKKYLFKNLIILKAFILNLTN